jgi:hypothetical protein
MKERAGFDRDNALNPVQVVLSYCTSLDPQGSDMVTQSSERANAGSSSGKFTITFETQPPAQVRPVARFTMPVVVRVEPKEPQEADPSLALRLSVWLKNEDGNLPDRRVLSGHIVEGTYDEDSDTMRGRAVFNDLGISQPGRYLFNVTLEITNLEENAVLETQHATADVIVDVNNAAPQDQIPSTCFQKDKLIRCVYKKDRYII